jgi:hypothetical protein
VPAQVPPVPSSAAGAAEEERWQSEVDAALVAVADGTADLADAALVVASMVRHCHQGGGWATVEICIPGRMTAWGARISGLLEGRDVRVLGRRRPLSRKAATRLNGLVVHGTGFRTRYQATGHVVGVHVTSLGNTRLSLSMTPRAVETETARDAAEYFLWKLLCGAHKKK